MLSIKGEPDKLIVGNPYRFTSYSRPKAKVLVIRAGKMIKKATQERYGAPVLLFVTG